MLRIPARRFDLPSPFTAARVSRWAACAVGLFAAAAACAPLAEAAPVVTRVALSDIPGAEQGGVAEVQVGLKARGPRRGGRVHLRLGAGARPARRDVIAGRLRAPAMKRRRATVTGSVRVPKKAAPGVYRLLACSGTPARPRGCRAAKRHFAVVLRSAAVQPVNVPVTLDAARAARAQVAATTGGRVEAQAADGTRFTLEVPAGALVADTEITLTPVAGMTGLPGGARLAGAVQMAPEGLTFAKPAVLTIDHPADVDPRTSAPVSARGDGRDFHLDLGAVEPRRTRIELLHFTVGGRISQVTTATTSYLDARRPGTHEAAARAALARELLRARQAAKAGRQDDAGLQSMTETALFLWARDGIVPDFERARTDEAMERNAVQQALAMERTAQLSAVTSPRLAAYSADFRRWTTALIERAVYRSWKRCVETHDLTEHSAAIANLRQAELWGAPVDVSLEALNGCARFELDGTFRFHYETDGGSARRSGELRVLKLPIAIDLTPEGGLRLMGSAPLEWVSFTPVCTKGDGCVSQGTTVDAPVVVNGIELPTASQIPKRFGVPQPPLPPIVMDLDIGRATSCYSSAGSSSHICEQLHNVTFAKNHATETSIAGSSRQFRLTPWEFVGDSVYARYVADRSLPECHAGAQNPCSSFVELTLRHTPAPAGERPIAKPPAYPDAPATPTGINAPGRRS